ncbi:MAG TPA: DUF3445 domain-containing protein [Anaerolineae bacterium]|nr:DUF3445 domain-containing protein [Anaerolineae bacterium]
MAFPYFPFASDTYELTMGTTPLHDRPLIEVDLDCYQAEIALKTEILAHDPGYYFQARPQTEVMQWEVLALVLRDLVRHNPDAFSLQIEGECWTWVNHLLGFETTFRWGDSASLPLTPLDWVGRQVQEDVLIMADDGADFPLVAGQLCFASDWCLDEKMGRSFLDIHQPVPRFAGQLGRPSQLLLGRLKAERPVWRVNWSMTAGNRLNAAPRFRAAREILKRQITPENAGQRCYLRVERQTLSRLAQSGALLFTVHTYVQSMAVLSQQPERVRSLLGILRTAPTETLDYKGITPFAAALVSYLTTRAASPREAAEGYHN